MELGERGGGTGRREGRENRGRNVIYEKRIKKKMYLNRGTFLANFINLKSVSVVVMTVLENLK